MCFRNCSFAEGGLAAVLEVLKNNTRDNNLLEFACGCLAALCIMVDNAIMVVNEKVNAL